MSTATPPRPRSVTDGLGLPPLRDVRAPRVLRRLPRAVLAGGVLVLLLVISWYLRTRAINGTIWFQEANAIGVATQSFGGVLHAAKVGGASPLYYLLLHLWVGVAGDGVLAVRWLSLIFALVCVPIGGWAGWSLGGERGGFYGAVFFALSSMLTQYSAQAQPYTLLLLLGLVASAGFLHGFVYRRRRYLWLFVAAMEAALYTQGSAGLFLFGVGCAFAVVVLCAPADARRPLLRDGMLCGAALLVLYIPWMPATIDQIAHATYPWHYTTLMTTHYLPSDLVGGERVDADLLVIGTLAVAPFLITRSRRRDPDGVALYALLAITFGALLIGKLGSLGAPTFVARYYATAAAALLLFGVLAAARTKIVGFAATVLMIIMVADPAAFATTHPSNMNEVAAQMGGRLHHGDLVVAAQPEQTPLAWYYLPAGLRWASTLGPVGNPRYMDWDDARMRLERAAPGPTLGRLVASLRPGQQLLFIRPLTEGAQNWKAPWASLVRLRAAQWGQLLSDDVAGGTLTQVASAPENYPGDCCIASSAVLFRKS
jgi:mannosyltransferase